MEHLTAERDELSFLLNGERIDCQRSSGKTVLDYLRRERGLTGTKEGCREGECGACVVLVGEILDGRLSYKPMPSCVVPLGELQGKHLVTIEGLNLPEGLTPVQEAIVAEGGTQCGFCTPGIVVSLTHCVVEHRGRMTSGEVKAALSGHLCRCTGYLSLLRAGARLGGLWTDKERDSDDGRLEPELSRLVDKRILPDEFRDVVARLVKLPQAGDRTDPENEVQSLRIAGGTDLYLQHGDELETRGVEILNRRRELTRIRRSNGNLEIGSLVTFEELTRNDDFRAVTPDIAEIMFPVASLQIRHRATLGGNVINASPIGDMTILLLALDAQIHLQRAGGSRRMALRDFFKGYRDVDLEPTETLTHFIIPIQPSGTRVAFDKVAKRRCLDIASVNSAIGIRLRNGIVATCNLALGGVAPVPKLLPVTAARIVGRPVSLEGIREMLPLLQDEIDPIDDVRGSAEYKRLLARQLVIGLFVKLFPDAVTAGRLA